MASRETEVKTSEVNTSETKASVTSVQKLLIISFVEGACVMVAELAGGKMLAPFYGTSLFVWASTLSITLGALTLGYYLGGRFSGQPLAKRGKTLFITLGIASALVMIMPFWANYIMLQTMDMSFLTGVVISQLAFLFPPILCMGIISPMIINELAQHDNSGKAAGSVYAISTLGGVISTLLTGFWLVPLVGISIPCIVAGALLLLLTVIILGLKQNKLVMLFFVLIVPGAMFVSKARNTDQTDRYKIDYHTEGILGQMKVVEFKASVKGKEVNTKALLVNHNWQTWIDSDHPDLSLLYYTRFTKCMISNMAPGSNVLLVGLGGGTVARQLEQQKLNFDIVEIDGRLTDISSEFFGFKATDKVVIDDGRHFINVSKKKYDLVIIDALLGENIPSQLLSIECFNKIKQLLNNEGKIFIEFDGIAEDADGVAQKMVFNTMVKAGYDTHVFSSVPNVTDADIMYLASLQKIDKAYAFNVDSTMYYPYSGPLKNFEVNLPSTTADILTDDKPALDYLLRNKMVAFRQGDLRQLNKNFLKDDMMFYY